MKDFKFNFIKWDGKRITKPGVYAGVPMDIYHTQDICDGPSVSSSNLRRCFMESPAHFYAEWSGNPKRVEPADKPHFVIGRAVHHLMLGEKFFSKLFAVKPETYPAEDKKTGEVTEKKWTRGAQYCKDWEDKHLAAGRALLTNADLDNIRGMAERLAMNPLVRHGILNGYVERSFFWKDDTGLWVKWRPDAIPGDGGDYADLKTTQSVKWYDLQKTIFDRGYFMQLGLGRMGCRALKLPFTSASLVFVEKTNPWCDRVVTLKDHELDRGERANRAALDAIADHLKKGGRWPGPGGDREDAANIELPEWAAKSIDDRLKYGIPT